MQAAGWLPPRQLPYSQPTFTEVGHAIRTEAAKGVKHRVLAKKYQVSRPAITAIVTRRNWKHIV